MKDDNRWLKNAMDWFLQFITPAEWEKRRAAVLNHLEEAYLSRDGNTRRFAYDDDTFAWYLVLVELYMEGYAEYDYFQGCRVIPYFVTLGKLANKLDEIGEIEERARRVVKKKGDHPDTGIFEILVALCYLRNGYQDVQFIPEGPGRTPDIYANNGRELYIECKRMTKVSAYSLAEREKWMKLWAPVGQYLQNGNTSLFFRIQFHEELHLLPDDFLENELIPKIKFIPTTFRAEVIDSSMLNVESSPIDYDRIHSRLSNNLIPSNSANLIDAVLGEYQSYGNYRLVLDAQPDPDYPTLIDSIRFAAGCSWASRSPKAIFEKSRHIKRHLAKAVSQLPESELGTIHFGVEAIEGDEIEQLRLLKSDNELKKFDFGDKIPEWIYYHLLSPTTNTKENWAFEESVSSFCPACVQTPELASGALMIFNELTVGFPWESR